VTVRPARCEDAPGIARVHVDSWRTTYRGLMPDAVLDGLSYEGREWQWRRALCEGGNIDGPNLQNTGSFAFVAKFDESGEIVGFASGSPTPREDVPFGGELQGIYLLAERQRAGIGRRLTLAVARRLVELGVPSMYLLVLEHNAPSRRFYEAIGGRFVRLQPFKIGGAAFAEVMYAWDDLVTLIQRLTDPTVA
jgi:ribosomal protein S18 acetylase RimI-like enzyme